MVVIGLVMIFYIVCRNKDDKHILIKLNSLIQNRKINLQNDVVEKVLIDLLILIVNIHIQSGGGA